MAVRNLSDGNDSGRFPPENYLYLGYCVPVHHIQKLGDFNAKLALVDSYGD